MNALRSRWPTGVRWQASVAAAAVVAIALMAGSVALVLLLQSTLTSNLQATTTALVAQDAQTLAEDGLTALASSETDRGADSVLIQVLDPSGVVVYTSEPARTTAQSPMRPALGETLVSGRTFIPIPADRAPPLIVARTVAVSGNPYVVLAVTSQEPHTEAVTTTSALLLVGIPLLVALTGFVTWWRVGYALRSVESIREQVEQIEAANLSQRVPVPATRDEIAGLAATMNTMLQRLESSDATQRRFVADASHELRSPLATLTASLELAEQDGTSQTWRELEPIMQDEAGRMSRLVEDLLLLSKVDNQAMILAEGDVDLDDLADLETRRLRQLGSVQVTLFVAPVKVRGDRHQLARLLRNLVDNAARAASSQVSVSVARDGDAAVVRVEDDGPGIAPADRDRVFERFVRLDQSRSRRSGGSGLGLAIVQEIAAAHRGSVQVTTSPLGGAAVEVRLPAPS
ncbi:ATP-binding protein [Lapillicoccus sp.]|uniref:sensor histidine kinase n=1 Tax=Lapillicoccus sp. TaxID=1909287 RepID=UPI00326483C8